MDFLALLSRWVHIVAAMAVIGGPMFMRLALIPAAATLDAVARQKLAEGVRSRWSKVVMAAIVFLLASGFYNFLRFVQATKTWGEAWQTGSTNAHTYQMLFAVKFTLALAIFFLASALTGRSAAFAKFRENAKLWVTVNLILGLVLVAISSQMRMMHIGP